MNKRFIKILGACLFIILLVAIYIFATGYFKQIERINQTSTYISDLNAEIVSVDNQVKDLSSGQDQRLAQAEASLKAAQEAAAINRITTNQVVENILRLGQENQVKVIPLTTNDGEDATLGNNTYQRSEITVTVTGQWNRIINFLSALQSYSSNPIVYKEIYLQPSDVQDAIGDYEATLTFEVYSDNSH